jgi:hypothetical protein
LRKTDKINKLTLYRACSYKFGIDYNLEKQISFTHVISIIENETISQFKIAKQRQDKERGMKIYLPVSGKQIQSGERYCFSWTVLTPAESSQ